MKHGKTDNFSRKIIQWTDISINVAEPFLRYLYNGYLDIDLGTLELDEWYQAKAIGEKYELEIWNNHVESFKEEFL